MQWTGGYAAHFLSVFVARAFSRFDGESCLAHLPLTHTVGRHKSVFWVWVLCTSLLVLSQNFVGHEVSAFPTHLVPLERLHLSSQVFSGTTCASHFYHCGARSSATASADASPVKTELACKFSLGSCIRWVLVCPSLDRSSWFRQK